MPIDQHRRVLNGRIGAYTTHSRHDVRELTASARAAFLGGFVDRVDPDRTLPEGERERRAEASRKAHFARLAAKSAAARRGKPTKRNAATPGTGAASGGEDRDAARTL